eukprot:PhM_4_TR14609/c0_g1_i1/m.31530
MSSAAVDVPADKVQRDEKLGSVARLIWTFGFLLCTAAVVLQIIAMSTDSFITGDKRVTEMGTAGAITSRVERRYGAWETCQTVNGFELPTTKTRCWDSESKNCAELDDRITLVQATGIIGVVFTGLSWVLQFVGVLGASTSPKQAMSSIVLVTIPVIFVLICWAVVANLRFNRDLCDDKYPIIDVDDYNFGYSFVCLVVAWCLLVVQMIVQFVLYAKVNKFETNGEQVEDNQEMSSTEPVANSEAPAAV